MKHHIVLEIKRFFKGSFIKCKHIPNLDIITVKTLYSPVIKLFLEMAYLLDLAELKNFTQLSE